MAMKARAIAPIPPPAAPPVVPLVAPSIAPPDTLGKIPIAPTLNDQQIIADLRAQLQRAQQDQYPFSFWPDPPWDEEPEDSKDGRPMHEGKNKIEAHRVRQRKVWLAKKPLQMGENEDCWKGVKFLGQGSYGCAGLWIKTNEHSDIVDVSSPPG